MRLFEFLSFLRDGTTVVLTSRTKDVTKCFENGDRLSTETLNSHVTSVYFSFEEDIVFIEVEG